MVYELGDEGNKTTCAYREGIAVRCLKKSMSHVKRNTPFTPLWMLLAISYGCMDLGAGTKNDILQRNVSMWITGKVGIGDFLSCRPCLRVLR